MTAEQLETATIDAGPIDGYLAWLHERGAIDHDPAAVLPGPQPRRTLPATFAPAEIDAVLAPGPHARERDDALALRDRALIEVIYGCGLRAAEACALRLDAVDL